jgi:DNA helicase-2/ATP-dependent DNA helicase PcrA
VLYQFVTESGFLASLTVEESAESLEKVQNLDKLFGIVARIGPLLRSDRVPAFIEHLDLLIEMGDDPAAAEVEAEEEVVSLLTAHGAKGLEFPTVFVVGLTEQRFPLQRRAEGLEFPPELRPPVTLSQPGDGPAEEHLREERRLFYVAMTRARDRLVLTHAQDLGGKRLARMSRFLHEALGLPAPPKRARTATALESIHRHAPQAQPGAPVPGAVPDGRPLTLSQAQVENWLECPLRYLFTHIAHVPLPGTPVTMYGNAMHHAIKVWHQHRIKGLPIEAADVHAAFDSEWTAEGFLTREHEERLLAHGHASLQRFLDDDIASGRLPLAVETEFRFRIGEDMVVGRWDRIDERPEGIVLVDYKTGAVDTPEKARERVRRSLQEGQLGLYALAYVEAREVMPARVELRFLHSGLTADLPVEPQHLEAARERVQRAAAGIRARDFAATPESRTCARCDYRLLCAHNAAGRS